MSSDNTGRRTIVRQGQKNTRFLEGSTGSAIIAGALLSGLGTMPARAASPPPSPSSTGQAAIEVLIGSADQWSDDALLAVELRLLNAAPTPADMPLPDRLQAEILSDGETRKVWLQRAPQTDARLSIPAGGFAEAFYHLRGADQSIPPGAVLSIPAWARQQVAIAKRPHALADGAMPSKRAEAADLAGNASAAAPPPADRHAGNAFLDNLSAYEPIYAVYGPGTNTEARVQLSLKYRLFGSRQKEGLSLSWRETATNKEPIAAACHVFSDRVGTVVCGQTRSVRPAVSSVASNQLKTSASLM